MLCRAFIIFVPEYSLQMRKTGVLLLLSGVLLLQACGNDNPNRGKPIVLNDSASIVTEQDPKYLQDFVADVKMAQAPHSEETPDAPAPDTVAKLEQAEKEATPKQEDKKETPAPEVKAPAAPKGNGLNIEFKEVAILIPNIVTRSYRQQDTKKANGASYELISGTLNGNHIKTGSGSVSKISQRYQTVIAIKNDMGTLFLESLNRTTDWETLRGRNNDFVINGLDERHLEFLKTSPAAIKNALNRAARTHRMSKATEQKWMNSIRNVRSANQRPLTVLLRSVMWKVEGKDAAGKAYQKQIRLDIPLK